MFINQKIKKELLEAIQKRTGDSFEVTTSGNLKHFISCEDKKQEGLYICTLLCDGKKFEVYMI